MARPPGSRSLAAPCYVGLLVNALNKAYKGDERRIHALLVPVTQMTTTFCLWCCGFTARPARLCALHQRTAPDLSLALQLSISGGANLAAAQRAAAASNSSFEIVRRAAAARFASALL
jgi:hypothetical protein